MWEISTFSRRFHRAHANNCLHLCLYSAVLRAQSTPVALPGWLGDQSCALREPFSLFTDEIRTKIEEHSREFRRDWRVDDHTRTLTHCNITTLRPAHISWSYLTHQGGARIEVHSTTRRSRPYLAATDVVLFIEKQALVLCDE